MTNKSSLADNQEKDITIYTTPENHAYFCPTPGEITRLALTPNKIGEPLDKATCEGMAECGFNAAAIWFDNVTANSSGEYPQVEDAIKNCRSYGIAPFIYAYNLLRNENTRKQLVNKFCDWKQLAGWYLFSPVYKEITETGKNIKGLQ